MAVTLQLRSPVTLTIKHISFFKKGTVAKLLQQTLLFVKILSAILGRCWWHNINIAMWYCLQSHFCLSRNYVYQNWRAGAPLEKESTDTFLQVLVMSLCQTFEKTSYFNKKIKTEKIGLLVFLLLYIQKCCWFSLKFHNGFFSMSSLRYFSLVLYFS